MTAQLANTPALDVQMLGTFGISVDGRPIPPSAWEHRRAAELVKLLALAPDARLTRDQVIEALWPHLEPEAGGAALHKAASHARAVLGAADSVVLRGGEVALAPDGKSSIDAALFEHAARVALRDGDADSCIRAAARYGGELLPTDRYAEWAAVPRDRLRALHLELLRKGGAWHEVVARDPIDEAAHVALMRAYAAAGQRAAALRQFRQLRDVLSRELGVAPGREAVALFEELSRGPAVRAPIAASRPLVGRRGELVLAREALERARAGKGTTLLVRGEAGIGKTRFCEALIAEAGDDMTTLRGAARPEEGAHAFAPLVEAFDRMLVDRPDFAERLTDTARRVIARLATTAPAGDDRIEVLDRQQVLSAAAQLVTVAAKERPVLLFLDDLHAADDSTLELFHYLARHARYDRIVLVGAYRPAAKPSVDALAAGLVAHRAARAVELGALSTSECRALAEQVAEAPVSDAAHEAIWRTTHGSPFLVELVAAGAGSGAADVAERIHELVVARIGPLDAALRDSLQQLAVLGESFSAEELLAFLDLPERDAFAVVDRAVARRLLALDERGYRFRASLVRDSLVGQLPSQASREAHGRAADALARVGGSAARIANHLTRAGRSDEVVPWLVQAARDEARVGAFASALELVDQALAGGKTDVELLAFRAELLLATGDPRAPEAFEQALARARGGRRAALMIGRAQAHVALGDVASAARGFVELAPPEDDSIRLPYLIAKGVVDLFTGQIAVAETALAEARTIAGATQRNGDLAEVVLFESMAAHFSGRWPERLEDDLFGAERTPQLAAAIQEGHLCASEIYLYSGRPLAKIEAWAHKLRSEGERAGARRAVACATCILGEVALLTGELAAADRLLEDAAALSLDVGARGAAALAMQRRAESALAAGDRDRAKFMLAVALDQARNTLLGKRHLLQRIYGTRVRVALDRDEAVAMVQESEVAIIGPREGCHACMITLAVPAAIACAPSDLERARRYLMIAEQTAPMFWRAGAWFAAIAEARGALARAQGDGGSAQRHVAEAAGLFREAGHLLDAERCRRAAETG